MTALREARAIAAKDLRIQVRGRFAVATVLPFAATVLIAFGLSLGPGRTLLQQTAPGLLWMAVLFASILSFRQAYRSEGEDDALEGLLLSPASRAAIFLGKAAAVTVELLALEVAVVLAVVVLFDVSLGAAPLAVAGAFVLGTVGLAAVGSLFGILAESPRPREAVFPLLVLPLATPILVAGARATASAAGGAGAEAGSWLGLLVAFDLVFVATGMLVYGYLLED
ncbi:MAG: heme exporter protein CcmB [Actinomycetota bacterium]